MNLFFVSVWLVLLVGIGFAVPTGMALDETSFGDTLFSSRSLEKREVFLNCNDQGFSGLLAQAIADAKPIISNMVDHLELAISLYDDDGSGKLKESKDHRSKRTFDEHNAFATYAMFITRHYSNTNSLAENKEGLEKLKGTRNMAKTLVSQYENYLAGRSVPWVRGGFPYITIYCDDADVFSVRNSNGLSYTEDKGTADHFNIGKTTYYMLSQAQGTALNRQEVWVPVSDVCALERPPDGMPQTRFGKVPAWTRTNAYVYPARFGLVEETMFFCPVHFDGWIEVDTSRTADGLNYRDLHVEIGGSPSDAQETAINNMLALPDFDFTDRKSKGVNWLSEFVTAAMIHESTHAEAFVGTGNRLIDVRCADGNTTTKLLCLGDVAKGADGLDSNGNSQGHKDAQGFAMYAMAMWVNAVHWVKYRPLRRETLLG